MTRSKRMLERLNDRIPPPPPRPAIWCKLEELRPDELSRFEAFLRSWTLNGPDPYMLKDIQPLLDDMQVRGLIGRYVD